MDVSKRPLFDRDNIRSIEDVQLSLETLEHDIPDTRLQLLRNFNATYLVITRNVRQHLRKGVFDHPEFLTQFDTQFAYYYFEALQLYIQDKQPSGVWSQAFASSELQNTSPFVSMALGVNAHVNNDIPLALLDCGATKRHFEDYLRVNKIIKDSIDEAIDALDNNDSLFHPQRRYMKPLYKPLMHMLIKLWRYNAWRRYIRLKNHTISPERIEYYAQRTGDIIKKLNFI